MHFFPALEYNRVAYVILSFAGKENRASVHMFFTLYVSGWSHVQKSEGLLADKAASMVSYGIKICSRILCLIFVLGT